MSWRIENANPFALVRELPDGWAQTCFVRAPRDLPVPCLLAMLDDLQRVLRDDGTLWLALPGRGCSSHLADLIEVLGWQRSDRLDRGAHRAVTLLAKQPDFHFNARPRLSIASDRRSAHPRSLHRSHGGDARRASRRASCIPASGVLPARLVEWCILAGSSPRACGICGAAWKQHGRGNGEPGRWVPACQHTNDRGRCLVLEPFCGLGSIGDAALRLGRTFLGIESDEEMARRARRRLNRCMEAHR